MSKKTIFFKPKYKYLSKLISLKDPSSAKKSVSKLIKEYEGSKTKVKKLRIIRAIQLASNRAYVSTKRKNLSGKEKKEFKEIGEIYDTLAGDLRIDYEYRT